MDEKTLHNLVTEAFPIVLFTKKLEDNSRKIMEITECEIAEDGGRSIRTLFRYHVTSNNIIDGKVNISGHFEKINDISPALKKRMLENGMPANMLNNILKGGPAA
jgi:pilus assembly protein CpaF